MSSFFVAGKELYPFPRRAESRKSSWRLLGMLLRIRRPFRHRTRTLELICNAVCFTLTFVFENAREMYVSFCHELKISFKKP